MKLPVLRITQHPVSGREPVTIYVGTVFLSDLEKIARVDTWSPENPKGYQRPLEVRRTREVAKFIQEQEGVLPTALLLATRQGDTPPITPMDFKRASPASEFGFLDIPDGGHLWLIDGQHRFFGVLDAFKRTQDERLADFPFPITILWDIDQYEEMVQFKLINTTQKKMSSDIVDRHLLRMLEEGGYRAFDHSSAQKQDKEYYQAVATRIVDRLDAMPGPWHRRIKIPGVAGRDVGLIRQHAFVTAIQPVLRDPWVKGRSEDDQLKVIANFWEAASRVWPDAFSSPDEYRVQATVGVYALHMILPVIIQRCLEGRDVTTQGMEKVLRAMEGVDSTFWHKQHGDPLTVGAAMSSIRRLAKELEDMIPAREDDSVKL